MTPDPAADGVERRTDALAGQVVVTTREHPGPLDDALRHAGATVLHIPLIAVDDPADGGAALRDALERLDTFDLVVVTSPNGARRVGPALAGSSVAMAAVGSATAAVLEDLAGRSVAVVPEVQRADVLVDAIARWATAPTRILVAQADRAADTLVHGLRAVGHEVEAAVAYRTVLRPPSREERRRAAAADAIVFVSGSAALAWAEAERSDVAGPGGADPGDVDRGGADRGGADSCGSRPWICVIGPTTAAAARSAGLKVDLEAADHSIAGVVDLLIDAFGTVA